MKRGFTLVELIVSVVIISLISGGALVYLNRFNSRQKLEKTKEEVVASIKLVQNYAKARQSPLGSTIELKYINLVLSGESMVALANNDVGYSYFNKKINDSEIKVTFSNSPIYFWPGIGRLAIDIGGTPYAVGNTETITIKQTNELTEKYLIRINASGQIEKVEYF